MKLHSLHSLRTKVALNITALSVLLTIGSCIKTDTSNDGAKFIGTWTGTSSCSSVANYTIVAGSNGNTVSSPATIGDASCTKPITLTMTASGNTLTLPSQTFTDYCGKSFTFSGSGTISGNTLVMTETVSSTITSTCTFTGHK